LDERCLRKFRRELNDIMEACQPRPVTRFCFAVEEGEAWLLGDLSAVTAAYPRGDATVLRRYRQDALWQAIGREKAAWAEQIAPYVDVERNLSPSFQYFRKQVRTLAQ